MNTEAVEHVAPRPLAQGRTAGARAVRRLLADASRRVAIRDSARALISSRLLVWLAGSGTLATLGYGPVRKAFDPPGLTRGFGWLGDLLAGPAARWDSTWFLIIAQRGYRADLGVWTAPRAAYFPVYPLAMRALSWLGSPLVLAGVLISLVAFALGLYGLHRLTTLEFSRSGVLASGPATSSDVARLTVLVMAFSPMALFFSAVYTESLFLALSVALFWSARHGRWALVGALGAVAAATRNAGVVLIVPALIFYLYGPREDLKPDREPARARARPLRLRALAASLVPRYRPRRDLAWLALMPAGLLAYMGYLAAAGGDAFRSVHAEGMWGRHFVGPFVGAWNGAVAAFDGLRQLLSFQQHHIYFTAAGGSPTIAAEHSLMLFAFLLAGAVALVGVLRKLPLAYGAYAIAALALPLSYPVPPEPLMSLPRFEVVLFPFAMWIAAWLAARPRARAPAFVLSALLMAFFTAEFATWHWVA